MNYISRALPGLSTGCHPVSLITIERACYNLELSGDPADRVEKKCTHSWNATPPPGVPRPWSESAFTPARPTR